MILIISRLLPQYLDQRAHRLNQCRAQQAPTAEDARHDVSNEETLDSDWSRTDRWEVLGHIVLRSGERPVVLKVALESQRSVIKEMHAIWWKCGERIQKLNK